MATIAERVMAALPPPGVAVTVALAAQRAGLSRKDTARALGRLRASGHVEQPRRGAYRLTRAGVAARAAGTVSKSGPKGPLTGRHKARPDTLRARLWRALRTRRKATLPDLLTLAARGREKDAESNARRYLRALERGGYVTRLARRKPGAAPESNGWVQWILLPDRDTGPRAPVWRPSRGVMHDPNTGEETAL